MSAKLDLAQSAVQPPDLDALGGVVAQVAGAAEDAQQAADDAGAAAAAAAASDAAERYQLPAGGIPLADLAASVQASIGKADAALPAASVVNGLTSTSPTSALSAAQGKALKDAADALATTVAGKANTTHTHQASQISDSTAVGRAVMTAASESAGRVAIGQPARVFA